MFIELVLIIRAEAPSGAQYHSAYFAPKGAKAEPKADCRSYKHPAPTALNCDRIDT